MTIVKVRF